MPYKFDTKRIKLPRQYDRRVKLTEEDKATIKRLHADGMPIRAIARVFEGKCSKRMIQFVLFPDRLAKVQADFKERRKDGRYYNRKANTNSIRATRHWKHALDVKGVLKEKPDVR